MLMPIRAAASSKTFFSAGARRTTTVSVRRRRSEPLRRPRLEPLITRLPEAIRTNRAAALSGAECTTSRACLDWRPTQAALSEPETTFTDDFQRPGARHGKSLSAVSRRTPTVGKALRLAAPADDSPSWSACRAIFKPSFGPVAGAARCSAARCAFCAAPRANHDRLSSQASPSRANMPPSLFGTPPGWRVTAEQPPLRAAFLPLIHRRVSPAKKPGRRKFEASTYRAPRVGTGGTRVRARGPR